MQTPYGLAEPNNVGAMVNALRGPQLAGDVVPFDFTARGNWEHAGPAASTFEQQGQQIKQVNPPNVVGVPRDTILKWLTSPSSQGKVYAPVSLPSHLLGGPGSGGAGGNLPPKM